MQILATFEGPNSDSRAMAESILLKIPTETVVLIFEMLPQYYRPKLAMACKGPARLAKSNDLLALDPTTSRLLDGISLRKIQNGPSFEVNSTVYPRHFAGRIGRARCDCCGWYFVPATSDCFRHTLMEARRLELSLEKGMLWVLGYEAVRHDMELPDSGVTPASASGFQDPKVQYDAHMQGVVEYYEGQMSKIISDVIRQDSYGYLKWKA